MSGVVETVADSVTTLRIDNEPQRGALSRTVLEQLHAGLDRATVDPATRAIILTGTGAAFCSGGDRSRMGHERPSSLEKKEFLEWGVGGLARRFLACDKPIVAAVNGAAVGAGMDLALWCDFRVAAPDAFLRAGYIDLGLPPGFGAAWLLRELVGPARATDILLTSRRIDAEEALAMGLFTSVAEGTDTLHEQALELAVSLAAKPAAAMRLTKRLIRQAWSTSVLDIMDLSSSHFGLLQESPEHEHAVEARNTRPSDGTDSSDPK